VVAEDDESMAKRLFVRADPVGHLGFGQIVVLWRQR